MDDREARLAWLSAEIDREANWLIQGRCGDDTECAEAKRARIRQLEAEREAWLARDAAGGRAQDG
ncbi:MAG TPA: hypothetical protein VFY23_03955 [Candidatus Limnocylindrales bacterium]|nr:hypothetical protein [Candidatus Limnocylindrales bacterium]